jgi:hypothetical protein
LIYLEIIFIIAFLIIISKKFVIKKLLHKIDHFKLDFLTFQIDRYNLLKLLECGSCAATFLVSDKSKKKFYCLKQSNLGVVGLIVEEAKKSRITQEVSASKYY